MTAPYPAPVAPTTTALLRMKRKSVDENKTNHHTDLSRKAPNSVATVRGDAARPDGADNLLAVKPKSPSHRTSPHFSSSYYSTDTGSGSSIRNSGAGRRSSKGGGSSGGDSPTTSEAIRQAEGKKLRAALVPTCLPEDGYSWLKYGEKPLMNQPNCLRSYFRCAGSGLAGAEPCRAKRTVDWHVDTQPASFHVSFTGEHNHSPPRHNPSSSALPTTPTAGASVSLETNSKPVGATPSFKLTLSCCAIEFRITEFRSKAFSRTSSML
ncbi:unnamed protein product [Closterium sp. NIES-53]